MKRIGEVLGNLPMKKLRQALNSSITEPRNDCPICLGAGFVHPLGADGRPDYTTVVPCKCVKEYLELKKAESLFKYCELPEGAKDMTFDNFEVSPEVKPAYDAALDLSEEKGIKWLTLVGQNARGKTHLAVAICQKWIARGKPARYVHVPFLLEELRRGFREAGDHSYDARFDHFLNIPLLVLDDLGAEYNTPWVQEKLDMIIDYRLMNRLCLVVTINIALNRLPFRIESRLKREPWTKVVFIRAPEYKKRKKK